MNCIPIAYIHNDFKEKFGIPRQSGLTPQMKSVIVFEPDFRDDTMLRGLENYSHLWLIWHFDQNGETWHPTVRPPRLGGNRRVGVFATRSPFRPNPIGLSSVRLEEIRQTEQGSVLVVSGADLADNTPILDIKPYIAYSDAHPDAVCGFSDGVRDYALQVEFLPGQAEKLSPEDKTTVTQLLAQDPRPSYQHDEDRLYGMAFGRYTVRFSVADNTLTVREIVSLEENS